MYQFLRQYRSTPHAATGFTPYRLMFQREPKTKIPQINEPTTEKKIEEMVKQNDDKAKSAAKNYADNRNNAKESDVQIGDTVLVKKDLKENKVAAKFNENPHIVTQKKGSIITATTDQHKVTRKLTGFKKIDLRESIYIHEEEDDDEPIPGAGITKGTKNSAPPTPIQRTVRTRREPVRFKNFVKY